MSPHRHGERGLVLPSWLVTACAVLVVLAALGFAVSGDQDPEVTAADASAAGTGGGGGDGPVAGGNSEPESSDQQRDRDRRDRPRGDDPVERRTAYVEVYNNSAVTGLAGGTAATLTDLGWRVVVTDNWYGEIPSNTVYHPSGLAAQADLLAGDLGIDRVQPAVEPMSFDRLTVILVGAT